MKVLHISKYYDPFIGGIEQVAKDIVTAIKGSCEQKIICFNHEKGNKTDIVDDVEVIRVGCFAKVASQSLSFSYGKQLKKVIKSFEPDIVIFHYPNPFVAHYLLKFRKKKNFRLVMYWHLDITKQKILGKLFNGQNIRLIQMSDVVLGATPLHIEKSKYSSYFVGKSKIIPYAVDEKRLVMTSEEIEMAKKLKEDNEGKIVGFFIGRHVPYKGLEYLIRASKLLDNRFKFYIAGQGPLTESLVELAHDDAKIEFIGKISNSTMRSYLSACDIFCFPSITRNEAFGLALAEGMYYEKPAVTFYIEGSGVNYVNLNGVTGIECPNGDIEAYANALRTLADDKELREKYGKNAKKRVMDNFTLAEFEKNMNAFLSELIGE